MESMLIAGTLVSLSLPQTGVEVHERVMTAGSFLPSSQAFLHVASTYRQTWNCILPLPQFDDEGGARVLDSVSCSVEFENLFSQVAYRNQGSDLQPRSYEVDGPYYYVSLTSLQLQMPGPTILTFQTPHSPQTVTRDEGVHLRSTASTPIVSDSITLSHGVRAATLQPELRLVVQPIFSIKDLTNGGIYGFEGYAHTFRATVRTEYHYTGPPSPWMNLGGETALPTGSPLLQGDGSVTADSTVSLNLSNAEPNSEGLLVIGLAPLSIPTLGGILVVDPISVVSFSTDSAGKHSRSVWIPPFIPAGVDFYSQYWLLDPDSPTGVSSSNGLKGTTR